MDVTGRFHRARVFFKTTAVVVTIAFLGLYLQPLAIAAKLPKPSTNAPSAARAPTDEEKLARTLEKIEQKLERLEGKLAKAQGASAEEADLKRLQQELIALDRKAMANFNKIKQHLKDKKLPQVILDRHYEAVATYKRELQTLFANLDAIEGAKDSATRRDKAYKAKEHLKAKQKKRRPTPLDPNNLPFRVPEGKVRKPAETKEEFQRLGLVPPERVQVVSSELFPGLLLAQAGGAAPPPGPEDLAPTEDVQITPEIQALADSLGKNPVKIFNWVHDNIFFMPTYGSIQGSQMTLETKRGNAFDTASLLIALLRASGIHARYVIGTVEIPIDKVMNWVGGVEVPEAALQVLGQGGIPSTGIAQGGKIISARLEHVWVEAFVDFIPSRGAVHRQGDTWVPMDGSFKQYQPTEGLDIVGNVPFDVQGFVNSFIATGEIDQVEGSFTGFSENFIKANLDAYAEEVNNFVQNSTPNPTLSEVVGTNSIIPRALSQLGTSLPYRLILRGNVQASLPSSVRHRFRLDLYASDLDRSLGDAVLVVDQSLVTLAGKRITLAFSPVSQADEDLINSLIDQGVTSFPGYLIRMKVELRIDGVLFAEGGSFTMGHQVIATSSLVAPYRSLPPAVNPLIVGEMIGIGIDLAGVSREQLVRSQQTVETTVDKIAQQSEDLIARDNLFGALFHNTVMAYFGFIDGLENSTAKPNIVLVYRLPSFGTFGSNLNVSNFFGLPRTVQGAGLAIDVDHNEQIIESKSNEPTARLSYARFSGALGSILESAIPQMLYTDQLSPVEGVSTVKLLSVANQQNMKLFRIDSTNVHNVLPQLSIDDSVRNDIASAAATGKEITVHQSNVAIGTWQGVGYIIVDPQTGSGAYRISGGKNGGFLDTLGDLVKYQFTAFNFLHALLGVEKEVRDSVRNFGRGLSFIIGVIEIINACAGDLDAIISMVIGYLVIKLLILFMLAFTTALCAVCGPVIMFFVGQVLNYIGELFTRTALQANGCAVVRRRGGQDERMFVTTGGLVLT